MLSGFITALVVVGCQGSPAGPEVASLEQVASVEIAPTDLEARAGTLARFDAVAHDTAGKVVPGTAIDWTTSDPSVAIVDSDGYVWSFTEGTATATASAPGRGHGAENGNAYGHAKKNAKVQVTQVEPDRPGRVTDLSVTSATENSISLSFTEVDDGAGGAAEYLVRFETAPLDWGTAENVAQGTCSAPLQGSGAESEVSCSVEGLDQETTYEFQLIAIRGSDQVYGDLSNVATRSTEGQTSPTPSSGSGHPNEPAGLVAIANQSWSNATISDPAIESDIINPETGTVFYATNFDKMEIVSDGSAPAGSGKVMRGIFPDGHSAGTSPWRFDLWSDTNKEEFDEIYVSLWMKIEGSDYENQGVGTKMFYIHHMGSKSFIMLHNGTGSEAIQTEMLPVFYQVKVLPDGSHSGTLKRDPNVNSRKWQVGEWTHMELYLKVNTIGSSNGILRMWLNGTMTFDMTDRVFRTALNPDAFEYLQFTPVWGGTTGTKTQNDYWRVADMYMSGN